jgi:hypothetical protein
MSFATSASRGDASDTDRFLPFGLARSHPWAESFYQLPLCGVKKRSMSLRETALARYLNETVF